MAIKVTDNTANRGVEETKVHTWSYGTGGVDKQGYHWVRLGEGAIKVKPSGEILAYNDVDLVMYHHCVAIKDPDLSLELIFTKGK